MDDRAGEDLVGVVRRLEQDLADLRSTALARSSRRPTGTIEATLAAVAPAGTLLLQGQTLQRVDFPVLWQWAQDHGAVVAGLFGVGNGSTTFTLPNLQGRVLMAAGTLGSDTYALGALTGVARHTLSSSEMPSHTHNPFNGSMSTNGSHGGHRPSSTGGIAGGGATVVASNEVISDGGHSHTFSLEIASTGGGQSHENRQPSIAVNFAVWT